MTICEFGEFNLIKKFSQRFIHNLDSGVTGIGDDCAVIPWNKKESLIVTTDSLIENVHFLKSSINPKDLGYKSLAVNLSDISAMGGTPKYAFLSLALPKKTDIKWVDSFFKGLGDLADEFNVKLLGGDTTNSKTSIMINITLLGQAVNKNLKFRSGAKNGDLICVTNHLGDSGAGLRAILKKRKLDQDLNYLIQKHHRPYVFLYDGQWLSQQKQVHAMIDLSDGVESDIRHIMKKSQCGVDINLDQLPISSVLKRSCLKNSWNAIELAACAGEDYALLICVDSKSFSNLNKSYKHMFKKSLYPIGQITDQIGVLDYKLNGVTYNFRSTGFDHFAKANPNTKPKPKAKIKCLRSKMFVNQKKYFRTLTIAVTYRSH